MMNEIVELNQTESSLRIFCAYNANFFNEEWNKPDSNSIDQELNP